MSSDIVGLQQIIITIAFLGVLMAVLFYLKRKGGAIRANLHAHKRMRVIEETAVSPTEKLRLISIDGQMMVMATAKNVAPSLLILPEIHNIIPENAPVSRSDDVDKQNPSSAEQVPELPLTRQQKTPASPMELTQPVLFKKPVSDSVEADEIAAFSEKFKSWRQR